MIPPLDIENKKFSKQMMNGYSVEEVDDFLDQLTVEYERLYKDNAEYKDQIEEYQTDILFDLIQANMVEKVSDE